jgi:hypothetical protein
MSSPPSSPSSKRRRLSSFSPSVPVFASLGHSSQDEESKETTLHQTKQENKEADNASFHSLPLDSPLIVSHSPLIPSSPALLSLSFSSSPSFSVRRPRPSLSINATPRNWFISVSDALPLSHSTQEIHRLFSSTHYSINDIAELEKINRNQIIERIALIIIAGHSYDWEKCEISNHQIGIVKENWENWIKTKENKLKDEEINGKEGNSLPSPLPSVSLSPSANSIGLSPLTLCDSATSNLCSSHSVRKFCESSIPPSLKLLHPWSSIFPPLSQLRSGLLDSFTDQQIRLVMAHLIRSGALDGTQVITSSAS